MSAHRVNFFLILMEVPHRCVALNLIHCSSLLDQLPSGQGDKGANDIGVSPEAKVET